MIEYYFIRICPSLTDWDVHGDRRLRVPHPAGVVARVPLLRFGDRQTGDGTVLQKVSLYTGKRGNVSTISNAVSYSTQPKKSILYQVMNTAGLGESR